jgi:hypothetical protein
VEWCSDKDLALFMRSGIDMLLCDFIEHLYFDDFAHGHAGTILSAVQHFLGLSAQSLRQSWRCFEAWKRESMPNRALPLPVKVMAALVVFLDLSGHKAVALMILVAFHCMLRTGEFLALTPECFRLDDHNIVVVLHSTKTSARNGGEEAVIVDDPVVANYARQVLAMLPPQSKLWTRSQADFRSFFQGALGRIGCPIGMFQPYSIRRGGASWDFLVHQNKERTLFKGRWKGLRTAQIYVQLANMVKTDIQLPQQARETCDSWAALLPHLEH